MPANILIVDDDQIMRELLRLHLAGAGYDVQVAEDAIAAGYEVLRRAPDLLLGDINMPHLDGFTFVEALKADATVPDIPVIFLTSVEDGEHRGKSLGAAGYVTKPVRADKLLALVPQHVRCGRPGRRSTAQNHGKRPAASQSRCAPTSCSPWSRNTCAVGGCRSASEPA